MTEVAETFLTVQSVSKRLACSRALVYSLIDAGLLGCYRIGKGKQGGVRVSEEQLAAYLKDREQVAGVPAQGFKHLKIS